MHLRLTRPNVAQSTVTFILVVVVLTYVFKTSGTYLMCSTMTIRTIRKTTFTGLDELDVPEKAELPSPSLQLTVSQTSPPQGQQQSC